MGHWTILRAAATPVSDSKSNAMAESETFCLQWREFEANVRSSYKALLDSGDYSDVTLASRDGYKVIIEVLLLSSLQKMLLKLIFVNMKTQLCRWPATSSSWPPPHPTSPPWSPPTPPPLSPWSCPCQRLR